jgi:AcrR family transcriptional regulator
MGRNKNPEQTLDEIITTSAKLFIEKGYEQTSIQDILDALGLSKGGLYHHFKSKEEILEVVLQRRSKYISEMLNDILHNISAQNAKEKLEKTLSYIVTDTETHALDSVLSSQIKNPYFVISGIQSSIKFDAPIISKLIEAGVEDGSIHTTDPELSAEVFLLLLNYWTNPVLFGRNAIETKKRLYYLKSLMCTLGIDIISDDLILLLMNGYKNMDSFTGNE